LTAELSAKLLEFTDKEVVVVQGAVVQKAEIPKFTVLLGPLTKNPAGTPMVAVPLAVRRLAGIVAEMVVSAL
jgi:hypothetical protein